MHYSGQESDADNASEKIGVVLTNLGTPENPDTPSLRRYLSEFLLDPRVIELPSFFRWLLVKLVIVNFRSAKSANTYREVWTDQGSPLLINTRALTDRVRRRLGDAYKIKLAMRYGKPSIESQLKELHEEGIHKIVFIPLYPQYSGSTSGSTFDAIAKTYRKFRWVPKFTFVDSYYQNPLYIQAIANKVRKHWNHNKRGQKLIMSFHGVPKKYITQGDPYQQQCSDSAQKIAEELNLQPDEWLLVFQSRFGAQEWLQPYCDETLKQLPSQGIKSVDIICPGFSTDCLETLEEINQENRDYFLSSGGESYQYIECLNSNDDHVALMVDLIQSNTN